MLSLLLLALFTGCLAVFGVLHVVVMRVYRGGRLLTVLSYTSFVSVLITAAIGRALIASQFPSEEVYWMAMLGAGLGAFFAATVYNFVGPVTGDRSMSAHLLMHMQDGCGGACTLAELEAASRVDSFLMRRVAECTEAGFLESDGERVRLKPKGSLLAKFYLAHRSLLGNPSGGEFRPSFER